MRTDTSEKGLETLIMRYMTGEDGLGVEAAGVAAESRPRVGGNGWFAGSGVSYDREYALDTDQLFAFLQVTRPEAYGREPAAVSGPSAEGDRPARHHRCPAQRHQAWSASI